MILIYISKMYSSISLLIRHLSRSTRASLACGFYYIQRSDRTGAGGHARRGARWMHSQLSRCTRSNTRRANERDCDIESTSVIDIDIRIASRRRVVKPGNHLRLVGHPAVPHEASKARPPQSVTCVCHKIHSPQTVSVYTSTVEWNEAFIEYMHRDWRAPAGLAS